MSFHFNIFYLTFNLPMLFKIKYNTTFHLLPNIKNVLYFFKGKNKPFAFYTITC